ncbi:glycosyltransferase family 2 protein [Paenibacillus guangzhouensis]|uniref:glycosyltransferase family 2 protein n=1 Tax=Paenibacillus guangzhouensis TaxID=1473112 RepID=UPI001266FC3A|nr:glycosyltransferase family A protein [Paenibacillus guangzhouensis]
MRKRRRVLSSKQNRASSIKKKRSSRPLLSRSVIPATPKFDPPTRTVSAILSVCNEEDSLEAVLHELMKLQVHEIILVMNGCTDRSYDIARKVPIAKIIHYPDPIGHDVGRAIGAKMAVSDILLFLDGDIPIPAHALAPFVHAVQAGVDVALNDITPYLSTFDRRDALSHCKEFLNRSLGRGDLKVNSMTAVPHALSRRALETIGYPHLMVPPKAQAIAIMRGLRVEVCCSVNVIERNKTRQINVGHVNPVAELIIGDHLEAIREAIDVLGSRMSLPDHSRKRIASRRNGR